MSDDRRVHARFKGMEIVRYDRAGRWYLEPTRPGAKRYCVSVYEAVESAKEGIGFADGEWYPGLPGGSLFDRKMQAWGLA